MFIVYAIACLVMGDNPAWNNSFVYAPVFVLPLQEKKILKMKDKFSVMLGGKTV